MFLYSQLPQDRTVWSCTLVNNSLPILFLRDSFVIPMRCSENPAIHFSLLRYVCIERLLITFSHRSLLFFATLKCEALSDIILFGFLSVPQIFSVPTRIVFYKFKMDGSYSNASEYAQPGLLSFFVLLDVQWPKIVQTSMFEGWQFFHFHFQPWYYGFHVVWATMVTCIN